MSDDNQPQIGAQIVYNEDEQTWQLVGTGASLSTDAIHTEIRAHATLTSTLFDDITADMYNGDIAVDVWQSSMLAELKDGHMANALFANGGQPLSPEALARVEASIAKEADFLAKFAQDVADGNVSVLQARARAKQYAQAMEQAYWDEWQDGVADTSEFAHLDPLPTVPGAGDTTCRGNCQCTLTFEEDGIHWNLNDAKHCDGAINCPDLAAGSPYRGR